MDSATLQIIIAAKDQASAALGAIDEQLGLIGVAAKEASVAADTAMDTMDASFIATGNVATISMDKAKVSMAQASLAADEMASNTAAKLAIMDAATEKSSAEMSGLSKTAALVGVAVAGYLGYQAVKSAGDLQVQLTKLSTTAGESQGNLQMVGSGLLKMAVDTGTGVKQLADAMYIVESAGNHGAAGLTILKAAAQGAKAENADLTNVADAVTSVLRDYNLPAAKAAEVTSKLVAAVGAGKANFNDFTGALHSILPLAASAHVSLDDIAGSMASMTVHGTTAQQAAENMADAIRHLQSPTQPMITELAQLGLTSNDVSDALAKKGLSGTMEMLSQTILNQMGPSGKLLLNVMNTSKDAARDANDMIKAMPSSLQNLAKEFQGGKISVADYRTALKALPTDQAQLMQQFVSLENRAKGFSNAIKAGGPDAQTYASALQKATGDASSLNVALQLTGENSGYTSYAINAVSKATTEAGNNVKGWSEIQGNMNFKMEQAKQAFSTTGTAIGTALLPTITALLKGIDAVLIPIATWVENNRKLATVIIGVGVALAGALVTFLLIPKAIMGITGAFESWQKIMTDFKPGMMNPWMLAIMALAAIALLVVTHWSTVKKFFDNFTTEVPKLFDRMIGDIKYYFVKLVNDITATLDKWGEDIKTKWSEIWNKFHIPIEIVSGILLTIFGPALAITGANAVVAGAKITGSFVKSVVTSGTEAVVAAAKTTGSFIAGMAKAGAEAVVNGAKITGSFVKALVTTGTQVAITSVKILAQGVTSAIAYAAAGWSVAAAWVAANLPLIAIGIAIAALIIIIVEIVKHWGAVKKAGEAAWNGIKTAWHAAAQFFDNLWQDVEGFFKKHWKLLLEIALGPIAIIIGNWGAISRFFNDLWQGIKDIIGKFAGFVVDFWRWEWNGMVNIWNAVGSFFSGLWQGIKNVIHSLGGFITDFFRGEWNGLTNIWNGVTGFFSNLWQGIKSTTGNVAGIISAPFKEAFNAVSHLWNDSIGKLSFNVPGWVPGIGGKGFTMPKLPYLASGTQYFGGGQVVVGEQGPEVVTLPQGSQVYSNANSQGSLSNQPLIGNLTVQIQSQAFMGSKPEAQQFATEIYQQLQQIARRHGQAAALPNIGILPN